MSTHRVYWILSSAGLKPHFTCTAAQTDPCQISCPYACPIWDGTIEILWDDDGPYHTTDTGEHRLETGHCIIAENLCPILSAPYPYTYTGPPTTPHNAPITAMWDEGKETYTWQYTQETGATP